MLDTHTIPAGDFHLDHSTRSDSVHNCLPNLSTILQAQQDPVKDSSFSYFNVGFFQVARSTQDDEKSRMG